MRRSDGRETSGIKGEREEQQGGEEAKAALLKQIRFGEIGLSLQDGDDLHPSITRREGRRRGLGGLR